MGVAQVDDGTDPTAQAASQPAAVMNRVSADMIKRPYRVTAPVTVGSPPRSRTGPAGSVIENCGNGFTAVVGYECTRTTAIVSRLVLLLNTENFEPRYAKHRFLRRG
jgi:hypothetical protein